ncbi:MAG: hypothetical protein ABI591_05125 [Kofleriaceae bacterium]
MDVLALVIAGAGTVMVLVALILCLRRRINVHAADQIVLKLARAGSVDRIKKLAEAAPNSYLAVYTHVIRAAETAESKDPVTVAALTHPAYDHAGAALAATWRAAVTTGLAGALFGAAGLYLGYSNHFTPQHLRALGGLSALAGVWFLFHRSDITQALATGRSEVLPEIDRAFTGVAVESSE